MCLAIFRVKLLRHRRYCHLHNWYLTCEICKWLSSKLYTLNEATLRLWKLQFEDNVSWFECYAIVGRRIDGIRAILKPLKVPHWILWIVEKCIIPNWCSSLSRYWFWITFISFVCLNLNNINGWYRNSSNLGKSKCSITHEHEDEKGASPVW